MISIDLAPSKSEETVRLGYHVSAQNTKLQTLSPIPAIPAAIYGSKIVQGCFDRYAVGVAESLHRDSALIIIEVARDINHPPLRKIAVQLANSHRKISNSDRPSLRTSHWMKRNIPEHFDVFK